MGQPLLQRMEDDDCPYIGMEVNNFTNRYPINVNMTFGKFSSNPMAFKEPKYSLVLLSGLVPLLLLGAVKLAQ